MTEQTWYLKPNLVMEPLVGRWYAWPHLVAPTTYAMNIANSQIKIMESFIKAPQVHAAAVKNPAMRGGPFLNFPSSRVGEIKAHLQETRTTKADLIAFAEAVKTLHELLDSRASGFSLEDIYPEIPDPLKGYVELIYDINHRPSFRFIEGLLYHSPLYDPAHQSIMLYLIDSNDRPFVFSTPRMDEPDRLHLQIPFHAKAIDELFEMRHTPKTLSHIKAVLGLDDDQEALFRTFLTTEPMPKGKRYEGEAPRIRYLGHASVLFECAGTSIVVDPVVGYKLSGEEGLSFADLPETIDYVVLTHTHADHVVFETLLQLRHRIRNIVVPKSFSGFLEDPSLKLVLQNTGFENVVEIDEMETIPVPGGTITGIPFLGEHADLTIRSKTAYHLRLADKSILCVADSANLDSHLYKHVQKVIGNLDVLFLGMECDGAPLSWIYGPLLTKTLNRKMDHSRRLSGSDSKAGLEIIDLLKCKQVYIYAMGMEPWLKFITSIEYTESSKPIVESNKLIGICDERGLPAERLFGVHEFVL